MDWKIDTKLSTITLNNCSTNDAMIDKIKAQLKPDKIEKGCGLTSYALLRAYTKFYSKRWLRSYERWDREDLR
jgi:hypothetical protein